jgi:hypothetical protein
MVIGQDWQRARLSLKMANATIRWSILLGLFVLVSNARAGGVPTDYVLPRGFSESVRFTLTIRSCRLARITRFTK